jgi:altronate dehydratase
MVVISTSDDQPPAVREPTAPAAVPDAWRPGGGDPAEALAALRVPSEPLATVSAGRTDVERLTALTACGAEVMVVLTATASPIGSPIAPTIKVSLDDVIDPLSDVVDVPHAGGVAIAERTVQMVRDVIAGRRTNAERGGARDVAIWRIAPYF